MNRILIASLTVGVTVYIAGACAALLGNPAAGYLLDRGLAVTVIAYMWLLYRWVRNREEATNE